MDHQRRIRRGGTPDRRTWQTGEEKFTFIAFFIYFISTVAETKRTPFDIPEAESELVAGWMTEYSGFK